jgi:hypothetical protein
VKLEEVLLKELTLYSVMSEGNDTGNSAFSKTKKHPG